MYSIQVGANEAVNSHGLSWNTNCVLIYRLKAEERLPELRRHSKIFLLYPFSVSVIAEGTVGIDTDWHTFLIDKTHLKKRNGKNCYNNGNSWLALIPVQHSKAHEDRGGRSAGEIGTEDVFQKEEQATAEDNTQLWWYWTCHIKS